VNSGLEHSAVRGASEPVLSIRDLVTEFDTPDGIVQAVNRVSYDVYPGETLGVVGESGSGKSVTVMSVLGLIPQPPGRIVEGEVLFDGRDLLQLSSSELRRVRGREIGMIFQDPMTSLNPVLTVGWQISEAMLVHARIGEDEARRRSIELLDLVGVPNSDVRFDQYPHEYSGGMRQRAMIAIAIANQPKLLIADEPTTALDVTIQAQVLEVLQKAQKETNAATILITHDLGIVAEMCDRVVVMYAGRVVEQGDAETIFHKPRHPYTLGLMSSLPRLDVDLERLEPIVGTPPSMINLPPGCAFHPRCRLSQGRSKCREDVPPLQVEESSGHQAACHFSSEMGQEIQRVEAEIGAEIAGGE
jgi:oligopeptide/dipeptide ABC transporter ATP-binding protein